MGERKSKDTSSVSTNYQHTFAHDDNQTDDYIVVEDKEELLNLTPIHKAKLRKERENNDEGE
jgi:hypothetical protein